MAKPDFPALLQPGVHAMTIVQLHALAVAPFPLDLRRAELHRKFTTWAGTLHSTGVAGTLWVDGSFLTEKGGPDDIDCVLWNPGWANPPIAPTANALVQKILEKAHAKSQFGIDLYIENTTPTNVFHREAYWKGVFGFAHDRITAKGFAEISI